MTNVRITSQDGAKIPPDFFERRHLPAEMNCWLSERDGDLILHPRLPDAQKLYIEVTTGCNLQCATCIRNVWSDPDDNMSRETFDRILAGMDGLPDLQRVIFTSFGEPLTHPGILEMIEAVRKKGLAVTLGSNGLMLKPAVSRELVRLGVDRLMVSVDGGLAETFEKVRGTYLDQIVENMRQFNEIKKEMGSLFPTLGFETVILKSNLSELTEISSLAAQMNASKILVSNVLAYTEEMFNERLYGYEPVQPEKYQSWALRADAWVMWATLDLPRMHWGAERRCRFIKDKSIVVGWDGQVSPCYALSHNYSYFAVDGKNKRVSRYELGNVHEQSLAEIWMSEDYVRFRSEVNAFHFPSCPDCDLRETCDLRENNEGCWGCNPSCADCLWAQDIVKCP